jgi:hypothetical protein
LSPQRCSECYKLQEQVFFIGDDNLNDWHDHFLV